jgi:MFS family permease
MRYFATSRHANDAGSEDTVNLGWYSALLPTERRTFWACFGGLGLDSMDTTIFALVMPTLIAIVGITNPQAGLIGSAYLVGSAVGGWGGGIVADRIGRVRTLQIMILFVAAFTFLSAFCSNFGELFVVRFLQGFGYGGESAIGGVLISEVIRPQLRGRVAATVQSGYAVGYAASVVIYPILFALLPQTLAWRAFLIVGFLPALFVFLIRRLVPESQIFVETNKVMEKERVAPSIATIFHKQYLRTTLTCLMLSCGVLGGAYVMITWLPTYLRLAMGMPVTQTAGFLIVNILGSLTGPIVYGLLSDRIGRRSSFVVFLLCQTVNAAIYMFAPIGTSVILILSFFLGAFQGGLASGLVPTFSELYPTELRANGASFCSGVGRGLASVVPAMVGILSVKMTLPIAMGTCAIVSYIVGITAALMLRDNTGVDLHELDRESGILARGSDAKSAMSALPAKA